MISLAKFYAQNSSFYKISDRKNNWKIIF